MRVCRLWRPCGWFPSYSELWCGFADWQWLRVTDSDREWLTVTESDWQWLTVTTCRCLLIMFLFGWRVFVVWGIFNTHDVSGGTAILRNTFQKPRLHSTKHSNVQQHCLQNLKPLGNLAAQMDTEVYKRCGKTREGKCESRRYYRNASFK